MTIITKAVMGKLEKGATRLVAATLPAPPASPRPGPRKQPLVALELGQDAAPGPAPSTPFRHLEYLMCTVGFMLMLASLTLLFLYAASGYIGDKSSYDSSNLEDLDDISYIREAYIMNDRLGLEDAESSFMERFKIGGDDRSYAKIDVPDFRDGKRGRFIHDFNMNQTGIMDPEGKRCYVMPLNRSAVLPPRSLLDLIDKMSNGYYDVDMSVAKETMLVEMPRIRDFTNVSMYIAIECQNFPVYRLKKLSDELRIFKRSVGNEKMQVFTQFAGKGFQELDIMNIDEVLKYEQENTK